MSSKAPAPRRNRKRTYVVIVIVLVLVLSSIGAYLLYDQRRTVQAGDAVRVDYIGELPDGMVFDTSMFSVASDNITYPKSLYFIYRGNESRYNTLNFTVGSGSMIEGFDQGVRGMKVGETKTIVIPPEDAYGEVDPSKITTINLTETVPVQKTMTKAEFLAYYGSEAVGFTTYTDPVYRWEAYVIFVDSTNVIVRNNVPAEGATYRAYSSSTDPSYGWEMTAAYDQSGQNITAHHLLDESSGGKVKGYDGSSRLIVQSVNETAGTATVDRNNEVVGKELTFIVTVVGKD